MSERPDHVEPGQRWGLWVYDDSLFQTLTVVGLSEDRTMAHGLTDHGSPCVVGVRRLLRTGELLEPLASEDMVTAAIEELGLDPENTEDVALTRRAIHAAIWTRR